MNNELYLKYVRPTEMYQGHTKVYNGSTYLGFFCKDHETKSWVFDPYNPLDMCLHAESRAKLLAMITKTYVGEQDNGNTDKK